MATTKLNNGQLPTTLSSKTIDSSNTINTDLTKLSITGGTNGQVLSTNGSGVLSFATAGGMQTQTDTFTSSGTWTKPAWAKRVEVYLVGGGAGGSSGGRQNISTARSSGAGGMGGAISIGYFDATYLGATESITIGAGGTGGASVTTDNTLGNVAIGGGRTLFGSHFQAPGGLQQTSTPHTASGNQNIFGSNLQSFCFTPPNAGNGNSSGGGAGGNSDFTKSGGGGGYGAGGSTATQPGGAASSSQSNGSNRGYFLTQTTGAVGGTNGSNGGDGVGSITAFGILTLGNAGGGGSYKTAQATGRGGDATNYGAGGGGGAASDNGFASGRGGNGSGGMAVVISIG